MALNHTMILGTYVASLGAKNMLKVTSGGVTNIGVAHNVSYSTLAHKKAAFVWGGTAYFPIGSYSSAGLGWGFYDHNTAKFENLCAAMSAAGIFIPVGDRLGYVNNTGYVSSLSDPKRIGNYVGTIGSPNPVDTAIAGGQAKWVDGNSKVWSWSYPFDSVPTSITVSPTGNVMTGIAELGGKFYVVEVDGTGGDITLYEVGVSSISPIGTPSAHSGLAPYDNASLSYYKCLFKFNGTLYMLLTPDSYGAWPTARLFEFDLVTGASTERATWMPAGWQANMSTNVSAIFDVRNDIPNTEQVFLVRANTTTGGWECYEFAVGGSWPSIASSGDRLAPFAGVIFDPEAKGSQVETAFDSSPSSYIETGIRVFDISGGGTVDIDPRYRLNGTEPPPYNQCTEKSGVGSEGVLALSSKPSGVTALADLSDDFSGTSLDDELWEEINLNITALRDNGNWPGTNVKQTVYQDGGAIRFGDGTDVWIADVGIGVLARWAIQGGFIADFTIADPENLRSGAGAASCPKLIGLARVGPNMGFGFIVFNSTTPSANRYVRGLFFDLNSNYIASSSDFACADGDVIRIRRDTVDVWTMIHDPGGANNDILPSGVTHFAQDIRLALGVVPNSSSSPDASTPRPGFFDLTVTNDNGAVGRFFGGVSHKFCWDHITDLGAGISGMAELFVDTQRT